MGVDDELLAAIYADLDNDQPRLVYADWLEEHGDVDRAAFIRAQCELARLPFWSAERGLLRNTIDQLYARNKRKWTRDLKGTKIREYEFRRGFLDHIVLNGRTSVPFAGKIFEAYPTVQSVKINALRPVFDELLETPWLPQVRRLNLINNSIGMKRTIALAECDRLQHLTALNLHSNKIGSRGMRAVMHSESLRSLRHLVLCHDEIGAADDIAQLCGGRCGIGLESLVLVQMGFERDSVDTLNQLFTAVDFPNLRYLNAAENSFCARPASDESLAPFLDTENFRRLEHFVIDLLSGENLARLSGHPHSANLRSLVYYAQNYAEHGGRREWAMSALALAQPPLWTSLEYAALFVDRPDDGELDFPLELLSKLKAIRLPSHRELTSQLRDRGVAVLQGPLHDDWERLTEFAATTFPASQ
ncbi:MAG: TIGR02996 domain-containing protein [Planctomycetales bacterium]|nr:TIGR02996 domain-containing protein [Planctomycetales bacterium]